MACKYLLKAAFMQVREILESQGIQKNILQCLESQGILTQVTKGPEKILKVL